MSKSAERIAKMKAGELCGCCGSHPPRPRRKTCERCTAVIKAWKEKNRDRYMAVEKAWRERNRQHIQDKQKAWFAADPTRQSRKRFRRTLKSHGISEVIFFAMVEVQHNKCRICGNVETESRLVVDHDHETGQVRGLLCFNCNAGIGLLGDDPDRLIAAANYLRDAKDVKVPSNGGTA